MGWRTAAASQVSVRGSCVQAPAVSGLTRGCCRMLSGASWSRAAESSCSPASLGGPSSAPRTQLTCWCSCDAIAGAAPAGPFAAGSCSRLPFGSDSLQCGTATNPAERAGQLRVFGCTQVCGAPPRPLDHSGLPALHRDILTLRLRRHHPASPFPHHVAAAASLPCRAVPCRAVPCLLLPCVQHVQRACALERRWLCQRSPSPACSL